VWLGNVVVLSRPQVLFFFFEVFLIEVLPIVVKEPEQQIIIAPPMGYAPPQSQYPSVNYLPSGPLNYPPGPANYPSQASANYPLGPLNYPPGPANYPSQGSANYPPPGPVHYPLPGSVNYENYAPGEGENFPLPQKKVVVSVTDSNDE
jgi:hypothetical protein